jgi:predicted nucleic-acid-binding Zn-ribbon protein
MVLLLQRNENVRSGIEHCKHVRYSVFYQAESLSICDCKHIKNAVQVLERVESGGSSPIDLNMLVFENFLDIQNRTCSFVSCVKYARYGRQLLIAAPMNSRCNTNVLQACSGPIDSQYSAMRTCIRVDGEISAHFLLPPVNKMHDWRSDQGLSSCSLMLRFGSTYFKVYPHSKCHMLARSLGKAKGSMVAHLQFWKTTHHSYAAPGKSGSILVWSVACTTTAVPQYRYLLISPQS